METVRTTLPPNPTEVRPRCTSPQAPGTLTGSPLLTLTLPDQQEFHSRNLLPTGETGSPAAMVCNSLAPACPTSTLALGASH